MDVQSRTVCRANANLFPAGFTLLELLVVLVIISLVSAFVGPRLGGSIGSLNLKTASKKLASALRYARSQAAYQSTAYVATLDFEKRSVTVRVEAAVGEDTEVSKPDTDPEMHRRPARSFQLPDGVRFDRAASGEEEWDSGLFPLMFYPDGGSSGGTVILADEKDNQYRVVVDFITGTVYLGNDEH